MERRVLPVPLTAFLLALVPGCRDGFPVEPEHEEAPPAEAEAPSVPAPTDVGTVQGIVRFAPGVEVATYAIDVLGEPPEGQAMPEGCPPYGDMDRAPVGRGATGGAEGVLVTATGDAQRFVAALGPARDPVTHRLVLDRCRLAPRLIVATRGDEIVIENRMALSFLPQLGADPMVRTLVPNGRVTIPLDRGGHRRIRCAFTTPCALTDVVVVFHPVHTITGRDGAFRLTNVPAGSDVTLHAWHPLFGEGTATVRVARGGTARVEIAMPAKPEPPPPPAAPPQAPRRPAPPPGTKIPHVR